MRRFGPLLVFAANFTLVTGCYSYVPLPSPSPGAEIRARLTSEAAVQHSQGLDTPVLHYDGLVVEATSDTLALDILIARSSSTFQGNIEIRDTVRLGNREIQSIQGRKLSVAKTILFTIGAGAAAFAVVKGIDQVVGGTGDDDGDPPPQATVMPLSRWVGSLLRLALGKR